MRVLRGPLAGLAALVAKHKVKSPALIVIGDVTATQDPEVRRLAQEFAH
ncbi:MAG: uroporphyrinogen-III C-methyltransferase, partial [Novosphingobium sp.]